MFIVATILLFATLIAMVIIKPYKKLSLYTPRKIIYTASILLYIIVCRNLFDADMKHVFIVIIIYTVVNIILYIVLKVWTIKNRGEEKE